MSNSFSYEILQTLINKRKIWVLLGSLFVLFTITGFGVTLLGLILFWLHFNDLMITWWLITFTSRKAAKCWKRYRTTVAVSSRRLFWLLIKFWLLVFTNFWVKVIIVIQQVSWRPVAATGDNVSFCVIFYPILNFRNLTSSPRFGLVTLAFRSWAGKSGVCIAAPEGQKKFCPFFSFYFQIFHTTRNWVSLILTIFLISCIVI